MKIRLTITIDEKILEKFRKICEREGYKISTKIEKLVEEFIRKELGE
jgi:metal-responsive CopG/Arc/MetJ family transcriptional regulator